ncbi:MAG TPA: 3-phosphoshikimate 1-carboxyvinyltransferase, partial [Candidatus Omnitrophota bacterium]|nr:3-phosphoshikimate 1-carboxyvinyltransferase [Candidatus Omnitrophota bacterium]
MQTIQLSGAAGPLNGSITLPGDKSLSHRAIIFGSLAKGRSVFT